VLVRANIFLQKKNTEEGNASQQKFVAYKYV